MAVKSIALLGSTGSIGLSTLDVIRQHPERYRLSALAAGHNAERLIRQAQEFQPEIVAIYRQELASVVQSGLAGSGIRVVAGEEGVVEAATCASAQTVVSAIVGAAGLLPTLAAIQAGKEIALANKECLVMAGQLFMQEVARHGTRLIPVDSEHNAIFQVLNNGAAGCSQVPASHKVEQLLLTASGGPFRGWRRDALQKVTPEMALAHPSWRMGRKITIDSATMMNKGLEVIEAHYLFAMPAERIHVVIHPQSIVHSMVRYQDGSLLAQMGVPDMRTPIAVALAWPERIATSVAALDLPHIGALHFYAAPDAEDFPCLSLAYRALHLGGSAPAILNAANEVAVESFLAGRIGFAAIAQLSETLLERLSAPVAAASLEELLHQDLEARRLAGEWVAAQ
ncbi:1-deoxy-D-xylulose-5-phosphate reductoisomerase [Candidatus Magnetaquicoccus inordinatus]|uniref:1-deoxy-D-xylulose-5-phosphate reductoisomerase n=1 Tax=Candidatus Magnetaquicoccus inordinatus TaxID=2496818 RepID=UPI001D0F3A34|nr:1-deoxy-D-xylulose-5-phosphate reductoisomerase [Candidatus Magnetaquicoccus inordinatus]